MMRGLAGVVLAALAVLTFAVSTASAAETHPIPIAQYAYLPASMTVRVGDVVTWTNQDQASHDVAGGTFRSPMLAQEPAPTTTITPAPAVAVPTTSAVAVAAAPEPTSPALPPMLLLAGLVAAVTTLCLLMIGSRPDRG